jgi:surface antigen
VAHYWAEHFGNLALFFKRGKGEPPRHANTFAAHYCDTLGSCGATPRVGAVAQFNTGAYGHVAIVTAVHGATFDVIESNWVAPVTVGHRYGLTSATTFLYP